MSAEGNNGLIISGDSGYPSSELMLENRHGLAASHSPETLKQEDLFRVRLISAVLDAISEEKINSYQKVMRQQYPTRYQPEKFQVVDKQLYYPASKQAEPDYIDKVSVHVALSDFVDGRTIEINCNTSCSSIERVSSDKGHPKMITRLTDGTELISEIPLGSDQSTIFEGNTERGTNTEIAEKVEKIILKDMIPEGFTAVDYRTRYPARGEIKVDTWPSRLDGFNDDDMKENGISVRWSMEINPEDIPALRTHLANQINLHESKSTGIAFCQ